MALNSGQAAKHAPRLPRKQIPIDHTNNIDQDAPHAMDSHIGPVVSMIKEHMREAVSSSAKAEPNTYASA